MPAEDRTLLLCCEEGELGYDPHVLSNVFTVVTVEDEEQLTPEFLKELEKQYRPKQVIVEYNGMWSMEQLYREGLPANWVLYQIMCLVDARTFEMYAKNMGQLMMEKITNADMLIFDRCNDAAERPAARPQPADGEPPGGYLSGERGRHQRGVCHPGRCPPSISAAASWTCRTRTTASGMWT